jgi:hypothetical protein
VADNLAKSKKAYHNTATTDVAPRSAANNPYAAVAKIEEDQCAEAIMSYFEAM